MASHHRGNHIIMSTIIMSNTSLWQQHHHQAVEKCKRSGTREFRFRLENTLGRKTLCFFRSSGCRGRRRRVSVSAVAQHDLGKLPTKSAQDCSEGAISTWKCLKTEAFRTLLEDEVGKWGWQNVHETVANTWFPLENVKKLLGTLLEDESGKMRTRLIARPRFLLENRTKKRTTFGRWG